ncbi:MAG: pyridoxal phosphate-dependent aminotransferase, partial [Longispora sp.]|nr:pyridoxal phosphate-dependent aminotransferase [Longispora sp. (in: high G+C Gram-positive bacteria)]
MVSQRYLRDIPTRGMSFVITEALAAGFTPGSPIWVNLGQGQPEVGDIPGAPPRITSIALEPTDHAYGPINGGADLRTAVADHY